MRYRIEIQHGRHKREFAWHDGSPGDALLTLSDLLRPALDDIERDEGRGRKPALYRLSIVIDPTGGELLRPTP